jgi:hypothetical protein
MNGFNLKSRLKILNCLALTKSTFNVIIELINDKNSKIRIKIYEIIINKVPLKLLTNDSLRNLIHNLISESEFDEQLAIDLANKCLPIVDGDILKFIDYLNISNTWSQEAQCSLVKLLCYIFKALNESLDSLKAYFDELSE